MNNAGDNTKSPTKEVILSKSVLMNLSKFSIYRNSRKTILRSPANEPIPYEK
jgi:hypothetical protein